LLIDLSLGIQIPFINGFIQTWSFSESLGLVLWLTLILMFQVIDKNGPPPKGTGIKQLRENIAESKLSYEIMDDAAQAFLKTKIMDNIQVRSHLNPYAS
jgi:hypothetical protein